MQVTRKGELLGEARLIDVSQVNVYGNVQVTTQLLREMFKREVPVMWFSYVKLRLSEIIDHRVDSVVVVDVGLPSERGRSCFDFLGVHIELPTAGPVVI